MRCRMPVPGLAELDLEETQADGIPIARFLRLLGVVGEAVAEQDLLLDELLNDRLEALELRRHRRGHRTADDQWRARFIDEHGVRFIDQGEVVAALDLCGDRRGHAVVPQVVEPELAGACRR